MSRRIYIVRHGNTFDTGDTVTRVGGRTDLPLSMSGNLQASRLAYHFAGLISESEFAAAFISPLRRTRQTAEAILKLVPSARDLTELAFLREIDYGPDENKPEAAVLERVGTEAMNDWELIGKPPPGWNIDPASIIESWKGLFSQAAMVEQFPARPWIVVTSNGIARFALKACHIPAESDFPLKLKTGSYGVVDIDDIGRATAIDWNVQV